MRSCGIEHIGEEKTAEEAKIRVGVWWIIVMLRWPVVLLVCLLCQAHTVSVCVSQRCSKAWEWWSGGSSGSLMDIILMGSSSTTVLAIRTGKRGSEDW